MFKVVLWDYTGDSAQFVKTFLKKDGVKIVRTLRPDDPDQADVILRGDWNFVLIFEDGQREVFEEIFKTMRAMNFSTEISSSQKIFSVGRTTPLQFTRS